MQLMASARVLALLNAGRSIAARMAMIAMTTSSSINVNPLIFAACFAGRVVRFIFARAETQASPALVEGGEAPFGSSRSFLQTEEPRAPAARPVCRTGGF